MPRMDWLWGIFVYKSVDVDIKTPYVLDDMMVDVDDAKAQPNG